MLEKKLFNTFAFASVLVIFSPSTSVDKNDKNDNQIKMA